MSTSYVQTRWYRAPELLLDYNRVTKEADIWSCACIMAELFNGSVLFQGSSPIDQVNKIVKALGTPDITKAKGSKLGLKHLALLKPSVGVPLETIVNCKDTVAMDLLSKMLEFDPDKRISAHDALRHAYFTDYFIEEEDLEMHVCKNKFKFKDSFTGVDSIKAEVFHTILEKNGFHEAPRKISILKRIIDKIQSIRSNPG